MNYFSKKRFTLDKNLKPCQGFTMRQVVGLLTIVFLGIAVISYAVTIPNNFSNGQTISSGAVNQNFQALADAINTGDVTCPSGMVRSGSACIDKYEASVWQTTNAALIVKIKAGTATLAELQANATQRGVSGGDLAANGCPANGNSCKDFYAVSISGVTPSRYITWFQAAAASRNSGKRLPTNQEWQVAALGTPDGAPCVVSAGGPGSTGTAGCVSDVGVFDMVGNLWEWVADWVPLSTTCPGWGGFSDDYMCLSGASTTATGPCALVRGGRWDFDVSAGVFALYAGFAPSYSDFGVGFRCAR